MTMSLQEQQYRRHYLSTLTLPSSAYFWTHSYHHLLHRPSAGFLNILWHHRSAVCPWGVSPWHQRLHPGGGCQSASQDPTTSLFVPVSDPSTVTLSWTSEGGKAERRGDVATPERGEEWEEGRRWLANLLSGAGCGGHTEVWRAREGARETRLQSFDQCHNRGVN